MSANILWNYPQSSCNCYKCDEQDYTDEKRGGMPTNFSVQGCRVPRRFECFNKETFKNTTEPEAKFGGYTVSPCGDTIPQPQKYSFLNEVGVNPSKDFFSIECSKKSACPDKTYVANDPRLLDPIRNSLLKLDRPPVTGDMALDQVYSDKLKDYGKGYRSYSDINAGQIQYYIDHSIEDAIYQPVYDIPAKVEGILYQDPMSNMKPQYIRESVDTNGIANPPKSLDSNYGCLSFINDTSEHREQLIARQQLKNNQQKWSARWGDK